MQPSWDECGLEERALILAFDQTRTFDCQEREAQLLGAGRPSGSGSEPEPEDRPKNRPKGKPR